MTCSCPQACRFSGADAICSGALLRCLFTRFEPAIDVDSGGRDIVDFVTVITPRERRHVPAR